jgi:hypothetical protein
VPATPKFVLPVLGCSVVFLCFEHVDLFSQTSVVHSPDHQPVFDVGDSLIYHRGPNEGYRVHPKIGPVSGLARFLCLHYHPSIV